MKNYLSFDFGGTFIKYALVREDAILLEENKVATPDDLDALFQLVRDVTDKFRSNTELAGIAISCPGTITEDGAIKGTSALPYLYDIELKVMLEEQTKLPVSIENDANCAALAELWCGAANGCRDALVLVIGTGIGGAVISAGQLYRGHHLYAGEFGYGILYADPQKHQVATWSDLGSTRSITRKVAEQKGIDEQALSGEAVFHQAEQGDAICIQAIDDFYFMLAVGLHNLQHIIDPERILIGGGISSRPEFILKLEKKLTEVQAMLDLNSVTPSIAACEYKNQANIIGAVYHFMKQ